jgi:putative spermidine/putrescine transport system substrate-binding protein
VRDQLARHARVAFVLAVGVLLCGLVAACGGDDSSSSAGATAGSTVPGIPDDISGTVSYYDMAGGQTTAHLQPIFDNFEKATGVKVVPDFNAGPEKLFAAAQSGRVPWDLALVSGVGDFIKAKEKGYLKKLDPNVVPLDKVEPGAVDPYGIYAEAFGSVITWNTESFPESGPQPQGPADFFNLEKFPGRRCMQQYPEYGGTLEVALQADGVPASEIYPLDVPRALRKLDTIKEDIVWWSDGAAAIQNLSNGTCSMGMAWSGRVFRAREKDHLPVAMTWNGATIANGVWVVPAKAPDPKRGEAFLSWFLQDLEGQKAFVNATTYATEIKALPLSAYSEAAQQYAPLGKNADAAIKEDGKYYAENIDDLVKQFNAWVGG